MIFSVVAALKAYDGVLPFTLEQLEKLRENREAFLFAAKYLFAWYYGKSKFRKLVKMDKVSSLVTVSDEAFILVTLHNSLERWLDQYKLAGENPTNSSGQPIDKDGNVILSTKGSKFTRVGKGNSGYSELNKGWNNDGIREFNRLYELVEKDRQSGVNLEKAYLQDQRGDGGPVQLPKNRNSAPSSPRLKAKGSIVCDDSDSSSDEEESGNDNESTAETQQSKPKRRRVSYNVDNDNDSD